MKVVACIAEVELIVTFLELFSNSSCWPLKAIVVRLLVKECDGQNVLMMVPNAMFKGCFDFGILRVIDRMDVDLNFVFVAVVRMCEVD